MGGFCRTCSCEEGSYCHPKPTLTSPPLLPSQNFFHKLILRVYQVCLSILSANCLTLKRSILYGDLCCWNIVFIVGQLCISSLCVDHYKSLAFFNFLFKEISGGKQVFYILLFYQDVNSNFFCISPIVGRL